MEPISPAVLRALARLSPSRQSTVDTAVVDLRSSAANAVWLGFDPRWLATGAPSIDVESTVALERLAAIDSLHREDRLLRVGWAVLAGTVERDGGTERICTPLVSWPVRLRKASVDKLLVLSRRHRPLELVTAGDLVTTPLVTDPQVAGDLAGAVRYGADESADPAGGVAVASWVHEVTSAAGLGRPPVEEPTRNPLRAKLDRPSVVAGFVVYVDRDHEAAAPITERAASLLEWAGRGGLADTAMEGLYATAPPLPEVADRPVVSALPLSEKQTAVVAAARRERITTVSGPPGCGKTHTLAALALDAVARGESVLLATRSRYAAEVIGGMLRDAAGPTPVLFGDTELRQVIADDLANGLPAPVSRREQRSREAALHEAVDGLRRVRTATETALADETTAQRVRDTADLLPVHLASAPAVFEPSADLGRVRAALESANRPRRGWFRVWRAERAVRSARALAGAGQHTPLTDVAAALAAAEDQRVSMRLLAGGGTSLGGLRRLLADADAAVRTATATWVDGVVSGEDRRGTGVRRAVGSLASALRAGRATRRRLLAGIDGPELVRALPLWVGTLGDVEDLLPRVPGLFDVVVVDEASHVDQPLAVPALVRARRAVVAGDPRQLRHVSFVAADQVRDAVAAEGLESLAGLLDVSRTSLFDVAAAATSVHWLDEHRRCAPHLIGFAGRRFYPERIALLTTHPRIADVDCIDTERVTGRRGENGVNEAEVTAAVDHAAGRVEAGVTSLGLLSPFRAQADAMEKAVLARFGADEITRGGLRVGTVHSFQGSECDELVVSLALSDDAPAASWRFVNDPNLLAVLTTRARRLIHVLTSAAAAPGLVAEYLRHADEPPTEVAGEPAGDAWTAELAEELRRAGQRVRTGYPIGRWRVDLVVGDGDRAVAVETRPAPGGVDAHLFRWRALADTGWTVHDAFPTRFDHDPARAAVTLLGELPALTSRR